MRGNFGSDWDCAREGCAGWRHRAGRESLGVPGVLRVGRGLERAPDRGEGSGPGGREQSVGSESAQPAQTPEIDVCPYRGLPVPGARARGRAGWDDAAAGARAGRGGLGVVRAGGAADGAGDSGSAARGGAGGAGAGLRLGVVLAGAGGIHGGSGRYDRERCGAVRDARLRDRVSQPGSLVRGGAYAHDDRRDPAGHTGGLRGPGRRGDDRRVRGDGGFLLRRCGSRRRVHSSPWLGRPTLPRDGACPCVARRRG